MRVILAALCAVFLAVTPTATAETEAARAAADRLVASMGGVEAWARAKGFVIRARHLEADIAPYDNLIQMAVDEPRMRFEGDNATMKRRRAVVGDTGWRASEVRDVGPMTAEQVADDVRWWEAHAYRTIARLARKDPALSISLSADGRLEVHRADGVRLVWYRLNAAGEPIAFGAWDNERGTVFGPLVTRGGGVKLPAWVASADGGFRAVIVDAAALPDVPEANWEAP